MFNNVFQCRTIITNEIGLPEALNEKRKQAPWREVVANTAWSKWNGPAASTVNPTRAATHKTTEREERKYWARQIAHHRANRRLVYELQEALCKSIMLLFKLSIEWNAHKKYVFIGYLH